MDYLRIFTPLDQPLGHWRGQSFLGAERASAPRAPGAPRAHVFVDGQNLFRSAKAASGYYDPSPTRSSSSHARSTRCRDTSNRS